MIELLKNLQLQIHGIVHCSGGAQTKVLHFIDQLHVIKDNLFEIPPLFKFIQEASGTELKEMYKVFNMGHRMEIYLPAQYANQVITISQSFGIDAQIIGRVETSAEKKVSLRTPHGEFIYS
jgi:phosphoribosylformylglycinamidine cyclo-ligase